MPRPDMDYMGFLKEFDERTSRPGMRKQVILNEIGQFMEMDQKEARSTVGRLAKGRLLKQIGNSYTISNEGYDLINNAYGSKIDYDTLVNALESIAASIDGLHDDIQPFLEEIKGGRRNDNYTRQRAWHIADRILNSTSTALNIVDSLRRLTGAF